MPLKEQIAQLGIQVTHVPEELIVRLDPLHCWQTPGDEQDRHELTMQGMQVELLEEGL
jgi:hypothetical protein